MGGLRKNPAARHVGIELLCVSLPRETFFVMADAVREMVIARMVRERESARVKTDERLRMTFWIFVFLLLTEGIFRRWILPGGVQNIFLVIRDPFVLYAVLIGLKAGYIRNGHAVMMMVLGVVSFVSALVFGHGNIVVAAYGVRIIFLYFPFIYICARVLRRDDVLMLGKVLVVMLIPMVALTIVQFYSPQSAFVNLGVGADEEGAGFGGALGYMRPPGIFTFIAGLTDYYGVTYGFLLYFLLSPEDSERMGLKKKFIIACLIAYFISIPVSISRSHFVQTALITSFFVVVLFVQGRAMKKIVPIICLLLIVFPLLMLIPSVQTFTEVFNTRFEGANESEGGLGNSAKNRLAGSFVGAFEHAPVMGYGSGLFSNFGLKYIYGSTSVEESGSGRAQVFAYVESETGRVLCEDGLFVGLLIMLVRWHVAFRLVVRSWRKLTRDGDCLPWLLLFLCGDLLCIGQLKASYHLGFMTIIVVSSLTALKYKRRGKVYSSGKGRIAANNQEDGGQTSEEGESLSH